MNATIEMLRETGHLTGVVVSCGGLAIGLAMMAWGWFYLHFAGRG